MNRNSLRIRILGLALLVVAASVLCGACKSKEQAAAPAAEQAEAITLAALKPILGEARDDISGAVDVTSNDTELVVSYRYYDPDLKNIDNDMVTELAPKIQALYKKFRALNRVSFQIETNGEIPGSWRPYMAFVMTRKIVDETQWSGILAEDFLRALTEYKRY